MVNTDGQKHRQAHTHANKGFQTTTASTNRTLRCHCSHLQGVVIQAKVLPKAQCTEEIYSQKPWVESPAPSPKVDHSILLSLKIFIHKLETVSSCPANLQPYGRLKQPSTQKINTKLYKELFDCKGLFPFNIFLVLVNLQTK